MKYLVISHYGNATYPDLFGNETEAYRYYANNLLNEVADLDGIDDLEYSKCFDKEDIAEIKNGIIDLMSSVMEQTGRVRKTDNGYAFCWSEEYTLEIFEVEER